LGPDAPKLAISIDGKAFMDIREVRENLQNEIFWGTSLNGHKKIPLNATLHYLLNDKTNVVIPKKIFFSYSHLDEAFKNELDVHFAALKRSGKIETWHDRKILPGEDWDEQIMAQLHTADMVLLLISADFMNSDYIWKKEVNAILKRQEKDRNVSVIPIFLRPCDCDLPEVSVRQGLPRDMQWIDSGRWKTRDEAYFEVIKALKLLINSTTS
jgi:internalin A